jgi:hypothetical protein
MADPLLTEHELRWYFYESATGTWRWDAVDGKGGLLRQSAQAFESRPACVLDAKAHGYGCAHGLEGCKEIASAPVHDGRARADRVQELL